MEVFGAVFVTALVVLAPVTSCAARKTSTTFPQDSPSNELFPAPSRSLQQQPEISGLIQGGKTAKEGRFPYMTLLLDQANDQTCGGVLVHRNWVATAAHCLDKNANVDGEPLGLNPRMIVGALDTTDGEGARENVQAAIGFATLHPKWNGNLGDGHDIALVRLPTPSKLKPIVLAGPGTTFNTGDELVAMGWGEQGQGQPGPTRLKWGELLYTSIKNCNADFFWNGIVKPNMMCAAPFRDADVCQGDSGGPLISANIPGGKVENGDPGFDLLVGLASFAEVGQCESSGPIDRRKPAVFTRISDFKPWIDQIIADDAAEVGDTPETPVDGEGMESATETPVDDNRMGGVPAETPPDVVGEEMGSVPETPVDVDGEGMESVPETPADVDGEGMGNIPDSTPMMGADPTKDVRTSDGNQAALEARFDQLAKDLLTKKAQFKEATDPFKEALPPSP